jgi:hypothetical protein
MFNKIKQIRLIDSSINQSYQRAKQICSAVSSDPEKDIFITMSSMVMFMSSVAIIFKKRQC